MENLFPEVFHPDISLPAHQAFHFHKNVTIVDITIRSQTDVVFGTTQWSDPITGAPTG